MWAHAARPVYTTQVAAINGVPSARYSPSTYITLPAAPPLSFPSALERAGGCRGGAREQQAWRARSCNGSTTIDCSLWFNTWFACRIYGSLRSHATSPLASAVFAIPLGERKKMKSSGGAAAETSQPPPKDDSPTDARCPFFGVSFFCLCPLCARLRISWRLLNKSSC